MRLFSLLVVLFAFGGDAYAQDAAQAEQPPDPFVDDSPPPDEGYPAQEPPPPPPQQQPPPPPQPVAVQPVQPLPAQPESVHRGFFLRFVIGANFVGMRTDFGGSDATVRGAGVLGNFSIGFSVIERLALHFDFYVANAISPAVEVGGSSGDADSLVLLSVGGGATYYLRNNMYFSIGAGFGAAALSTAAGSSVGSTGGGVTARILVGKEWWMGTEWGIGIAGHFGFARLPDGPADWTLGTIGVGLSITKN